MFFGVRVLFVCCLFACVIAVGYLCVVVLFGCWLVSVLCCVLFLHVRFGYLFFARCAFMLICVWLVVVCVQIVVVCLRAACGGLFAFVFVFVFVVLLSSVGGSLMFVVVCCAFVLHEWWCLFSCVC